jgi:O-antigen/teichoic acid export membrane protein
MLSFVGQDLTAKFAYSVRVQSVGIILNMFFGVIVNAANGIATTVNGSVSAFSSNMFVAFNPQIIKNYASGNINRMLQLIYTSSKYSLLLISIAVIPLELEMGYVLRLWLGSVPEYCQIFCQITLFSLLTVCTQSIYTGLQATGDIKQYSIVQTITYLLCPIIMYILCRFFRIPSLAYIVVIVTQFVTVSILVFIFKQKVQAFSIRTYAVQIFQALFVITIAVIVGIVIHKQLTESFLRLSLITVCSAIIILSSAFIMLDKTQRHVVISNIRNRIKI